MAIYSSCVVIWIVTLLLTSQGHSDNQGEVWKTLQSWLYFSSNGHLRLLYDGLSTLFYFGKLIGNGQFK